MILQSEHIAHLLIEKILYLLVKAEQPEGTPI